MHDIQHDSQHVFIKLKCFGGGREHTFPLLRDRHQHQQSKQPNRSTGGKEEEGEEEEKGEQEQEEQADLFRPQELEPGELWGRWMREYFGRGAQEGKEEEGGQEEQEQEQEQEQPGPSVAQELSAANPRVLYVPNFLSRAECEHMIRVGMRVLPRHAYEVPDNADGVGMGTADSNSSGMLPVRMKSADPIVAAVEARIGELTGIAPHADEDEINLVYRPEATTTAARRGAAAAARGRRCGGSGGGSGGGEEVLNVHLDARLGRPHSAVTVLVYLNDVAEGGGTIFPCANQPANAVGDKVRRKYVEAFERGQDYLHLGSPQCTDADRELLTMAERAARRCGGSGGLLTSPQRGAAAVFWTLTPCGQVGPAMGPSTGPSTGPAMMSPWSRWQRDPLAWHGGLRVREGGNGKWILQKFKELPVEFRGSLNELATPNVNELVAAPDRLVGPPAPPARAKPRPALDDID
jgi:hypothetical protein